METLRKEHKIILLVCFICTIVALFLFFFGNGPTRKKMKSLKREVADMSQTLTGLGMPGEQVALQSMLSVASGAKEDVEERLSGVMACYSAMYRPMIEGNNWTLKSFIQQKPKPSRDMYMREYERIITKSPYGNLDSSSERIGLSRDSDSEQRWRLLLQLWCVEKLLTGAHEKGLQLVFEYPEIHNARERSSAGNHRKRQNNQSLPARGVPIADMRILPPVEVIGKAAQKTAEMLKLEFRMGISGTLPQLTAFLEQLGTQESFFGIDSFELLHKPPRKGAAPKGQGTIQMNLSLVTFVNLKHSEENNSD